MADIFPTSVHLPIDINVVNAALVHEPIVDNTQPTVQNLKDIVDNGVSLAEFLDDETHIFSEPKNIIDIPQLTATGAKLRDVKILSGAETVTIPVQSFNYLLYALMHGLDPATAIVNNQNAKWDEDGYAALDGSPVLTFDRVVTILNRVESIDTIRFALLAQVQPSDPTLGDKFILCPKLAINVEEIQQSISQSRFQSSINFRSLVLTDAETTRWQNMAPFVRKSIGMYSFHADVVV